MKRTTPSTRAALHARPLVIQNFTAWADAYLKLASSLCANHFSTFSPHRLHARIRFAMLYPLAHAVGVLEGAAGAPISKDGFGSFFCF